MKKLNIISIGLLATALTVTSCKDSFLEQEPQTKGDVESYFATEEHLTEDLSEPTSPFMTMITTALSSAS